MQANASFEWKTPSEFLCGGPRFIAGPNLCLLRNHPVFYHPIDEDLSLGTPVYHRIEGLRAGGGAETGKDASGDVSRNCLNYRRAKRESQSGKA
jgi:hypothetical protein